MESNYYGQFFISRRERRPPEGYSVTQYGQWFVYSHSSLSLTYLNTQDGRPIGTIMGRAIDTAEGAFVGQDIALPFKCNDAAKTKEHVIQQFLTRIGGRFACLISDNDLQRFYLDAGGSLSCVYLSDDEVIAASPGLVLDSNEYDCRLNKELARLLNIPIHGWYPGGITPHSGVYRLLPNHYLDMKLWRAVRYWPVAEIATTDSVDDNVSVIVERIKGAIRAMTRTHRAYLPITAGRDSRMLLACARMALQQIQLFTFVDVKESVDQYIVKKLDAAYQLNVQYLPIRYASPEQRAQWCHQVGHCVGGRISELYPTLAGLNSEYMIMPGLGGEVGRAYYWKSGDSADATITAEELLRRFHLPAHPILRSALDSWIEELDGVLTTYQLLDIAYIENRLGAWGGPQTYGQAKFVDHVYPLIDRVLFENILALPPRFKSQGRLALEIIRREWPELLGLPFNKYLGVRGWFESAKRVRRLPAKIIRTISRYRL